MIFLYNLSIWFYYLAIVVISFINKKAWLWVKGRKNIFQTLIDKIGDTKDIIWIHAASLGEFEQGRPLIEAIKDKNRNAKILLTFFSPSGYEIRKNYNLGDFVCYLPMDTARNAKRFINIVKPSKVFFIKYEFWFHYLKRLYQLKIPVYLISAKFRPNQAFFKAYGGWYRKIIYFFNHIFVQDQGSKYLLSKIDYCDVTVSGDTRFDRVHSISLQLPQNAMVELFKMKKNILIAGSTWPEDETLLVAFINQCKYDWKFIIAPHEINKSHIDKLIQACKRKTILYSQVNDRYLSDYDVLIIDNIGMLSSLYRYGNIAYVGGGFGKGIHNILEAATFGMPVLFGPKYKKFNEACEMIQQKGAFSIHDMASLSKFLDFFICDEEQLKQASQIASNYVASHIGATKKIMEYTMNE